MKNKKNMRAKRFNWLTKTLGLKTMRDWAIYKELRRAFGVKESLELMCIEGVA